MNAKIINAIFAANVIEYSLCKFNIIITGGPITRGLRVTHCNIYTPIKRFNLEVGKIKTFENDMSSIFSNVIHSAHTST